MPDGFPWASAVRLGGLADPAALAVLLMFTVTPTDRALAGWIPHERNIPAVASQQWIADYVRPEYQR